IDSSTGADVVATQSVVLSGASNLDTTNLVGGGAVISFDTNFGGNDNDVRYMIVDNAGTASSIATIDNSVADDSDAAVAGLDGGNFAMAWTRKIGGQTEMWYAVVKSDFSFAQAPVLFDTQGTINRDVSVVALANGGFALAYEDNESGSLSISLA